MSVPGNQHTIFIDECPHCEGTGRHLVYYSPRQGDIAPCNEVDVGPCRVCDGRGEIETEYECRTLEDLEAEELHYGRIGQP